MRARVSAGVIYASIFRVNTLIEGNDQAYYAVESKSLGESGSWQMVLLRTWSP